MAVGNVIGIRAFIHEDSANVSCLSTDDARCTGEHRDTKSICAVAVDTTSRFIEQATALGGSVLVIVDGWV